MAKKKVTEEEVVTPVEEKTTETKAPKTKKVTPKKVTPKTTAKKTPAKKTAAKKVTAVEPEPPKGSKTRSPSLELARISFASSFSGFWVGCAVFSDIDQ